MISVANASVLYRHSFLVCVCNVRVQDNLKHVIIIYYTLLVVCLSQ